MARWPKPCRRRRNRATMKRFEGKVVLVTGAASGIGRATALRVAEEGADVACVDVSLPGLRETAESVEAFGRKVAVFECDVSQEESVEKTVHAVVARFGKIDVLCNIAGILRSDHSHELKLADWNKI